MWQLLIPAITSIIDKVLPDAGAAQQAKAHILEMQVKGELDSILGQLEINKEEAKSASVFVSGWRPFIGWVCGSALAYAAILEPLLRFVSMTFFDYHGGFPVIDNDLTLQVLLGMLGLGAMRSYEKRHGVAAK